MSLVKICGITEEQEVEYVNEAGVDFMGMVMFFPKSKRNITVEKASSLIKKLNPAVTSVAVTVEPTLDQIREIEAAGIQMIQIHGDVSEELLQEKTGKTVISISAKEEIRIPVIKAFNVHDLSSYERYHQADIVKGYIFDAQTPGSGKTFDWSVLSDIPHDEKFALLAGGLNPDNVAEAFAATHVDGADTSSGVENDTGIGKDREKILRFVENVKNQ